jgi:hypothetical protein
VKYFSGLWDTSVETFDVLIGHPNFKARFCGLLNEEKLTEASTESIGWPKSNRNQARTLRRNSRCNRSPDQASRVEFSLLTPDSAKFAGCRDLVLW